MKFLLSSDWHLTCNEKDEYRWGLFDQLNRLILDHKINRHIIAGDLTDSKDNHPAKLVNRLVYELAVLADRCPIILLRGNHDGVDQSHPYFEFTKLVKGIRYCKEPMEYDGIFFLPHSRNPLEDWKGINFKDKYVVAHVTIDGAIVDSSTHTLSSPIKRDYFKQAKLVFSGDIHKPQTVGSVIYIGSPYNVHFGDQFDGGVVILDTETAQWQRIKLDFPSKLTFTVLTIASLKDQVKESLKSTPDAFVKLRLIVDQNNLDNWKELRAEMSAYLAEETPYQLQQFEIVNKVAPKLKEKSAPSEFTNFESYCSKYGISSELSKFGADMIKEVETGAV